MPFFELGEAVPRRNSAFARGFGKTLFKILEWRGWKLKGTMPNVSKCVLIGAPHTSNWDFVVGMTVLLATDVNTSWLGKDAVFRWPFGRLARWLGGIPVYRNQQLGVVGQMVQVFNDREKMVLGLAPEGTRSLVKQWKMGFYHIAVGAGVPIVLGYFDYAKKEVGFGPLIVPTGDVNADLAKINAFYADKTGKRPELFSLNQIEVPAEP